METVLVIGAARSGIAVSRLLHDHGVHVILTDSKAIADKAELEASGIEVYDNGHPDMLKQREYTYIVKNPGIPYTVPFVAYFVNRQTPIYNEIEVALWYAPHHRIAAITGTNGKTTTTTLLGEILKANNRNAVAAGNIGLPLSEAVRHHEQENRDVALEIAAFQLTGTRDFCPYVSTIINLTPDHLDVYKEEDAYYRAKTLVYRNQKPDGYFLRNVDDPVIMRYATDVPCQVLDVSLVRKDTDVCIRDGVIYCQNTALFAVDTLHLPGRHNLHNAMLAATMAYVMGVSPQLIAEVIARFQGVEHRIEFVAEIDGVRYYNDSKGTNVDATSVALRAFTQPVHLLAGGYDKKTGFADLVPYTKGVKQMYVFGTVKQQLKDLFPDAIVCETMAEALELAHRNAVSGEVVLLSPACASWDQFPNYEVRGEQFKQQVHGYEK